MRSSRCLGCPWRIYASQSTRDGLWRAKVKQGSHSDHEFPKNPRIFHEYRKGDHERVSQVVEMTNNMLTPAQIMRQTSCHDCTPYFTAKDIYNIRQTMSHATSGMEVLDLHDFLHARGYIIRYDVNDENIITKLFITQSPLNEQGGFMKLSLLMLHINLQSTSFHLLILLELTTWHQIHPLFHSDPSTLHRQL